MLLYIIELCLSIWLKNFHYYIRRNKNILKLLNYTVDIIIKLCYIITIAKNKTKKPTGAATNSHRSAPIKRKVALL
nr:MAG TPA: hypothetical protein [Bacteriophage sp.]